MQIFTKISGSRLRSRIQCLITLMAISLSGFSQSVAINTTLNPANPAAGLDIDFPSSGFLVTRMPLTSLSSFAPLSAHVAGMMLFNTATTANVTPGLYFDDGTKWVAFMPPAGNAVHDMLYWDGTGWAILAAGVAGQRLQLTSAGIPAWSNGSLSTLSTVAVSSITTTSASSGGNITSDGGTPVTARGVCWSTSSGPTIADSKTIDGAGVGSFTSSLTGLATGTTYYVRAYATNSSGTAYGNEVSFVTL
jgi:hypothetical protein